MSDLRRVGVKFFCRTGVEIPLPDFIPVFHRWIQTSAVDGVLIDVADYSHVPEGPGVILVSHEGIYAIDESRGRRGLAYHRRRPRESTLDDSLSASLRAAARACRLLEEEFGGRIRFRGDEVEVFAIDRLLAPNADETKVALDPVLQAVAERLFAHSNCGMTYEQDPRALFSVTLKSPAEVAFSDVAGRVIG